MLTLDDLQKLVDAATPGEWDATHISSGYEAITVMDLATGKHTQVTHTITVADAAFIVAARIYLPKFLAVARAAKDYADRSDPMISFDKYERLAEALSALEMA